MLSTSSELEQICAIYIESGEILQHSELNVLDFFESLANLDKTWKVCVCVRFFFILKTWKQMFNFFFFFKKEKKKLENLAEMLKQVSDSSKTNLKQMLSN
jgi:hypothetical protein